MSERRPKRRAIAPDDADQPLLIAPTVGRRERNKRDKRQRILDAARTLFRANGFESTTLQQIADLADVGFGTLYLHAESKEDLLILVFKGEMDGIVEEAFASVPEQATLIAQLEHMFGRYVDYHDEDLALARILIRELSVLSSARRRRDVLALMRTIFAKLGQLVTRAQQRGEVRADVVPVQAARLVFAVYYQLLQTFLGEYLSEPSFRAHFRKSLELLMTGLSPAARGAATRRPKRRASRRPGKN